jgi:UDP-N-acetylglucosamine 2-epimerase (non-hydrolysing)
VFAAALAAFYQNVPVAHVEAGLRTGNIGSPFPEEANRVLTSRLVSMHFVPTAESRDNLLREHVPPDRIIYTGNTIIDALHLAVRKVQERRPSIPGLDHVLWNANPKPLVLITAHRRESFGEKLRSICLAIADLALQFPDTHFVYPVHPNPSVRSMVQEVLATNRRPEANLENVHLIEPLSYLAFVALMKQSTLLLTDSGGIQEEAPSLGKPVLVTRDTTERPEAVKSGTVKLVGADRQRIVHEVSRLLTDSAYYAEMSRAHSPYGDGHATERILAAIVQQFQLGPGRIPEAAVA